jgi:WD40 repeat protein/Tfp pilus assembly protein PilF
MYDEAEKTKKAKGRLPRQRPSVIIIEVLFVIVAVVAAGRYLFGSGSSAPIMPPTATPISAATWYERGSAQLDEQDYAAALQSLTEAISAGYAPLHMAYFQRGRVNYALNEYRSAIEDYTISLEIAPECDECEIDYYNRGLSYEKLGDYAAALADYSRAIDIRPNYYNAYRVRGALYTYLGQELAALQDWQRLLKMQATDIIERRALAEGIKRDGLIASPGEQTHFVFSATAGSQVTLFAASDVLDLVLLLRDNDGQPLAFSDDAGDETLNARIVRFVIPQDGDYTAVVAGYDETATGEFTFSFTIATPAQVSPADFAPITPDTVARLTEYAVWQRQWENSNTVWSSDGRWLYEEDFETGILRYDTQATTPRGENIIAYEDFIYRLSVSPNERLFVLGNGDTVLLYHATNGQRIAIMRELDSSALQFAWNADSTWLTTASNNAKIYVWNTLDGSVATVLETGTIASQTVAFHPTRPLLVIGGMNGRVELWNVTHSEHLHSYTLPDEVKIVQVAFTPNGDTVVIADEQGKIWQVNAALTPEIRYDEHTIQPIEHLVFSPDGRLVASATHDGKVHVWDFASGKQLAVLTTPPRESLSSVAFRADGRTLVMVTADQQVRLWRVGE